MIDSLVEYLQPFLTESRVGIGMFSDTYDESTVLNWKSGIQPTYSLGNRDPYRRRPFLQVIVRSKSFSKVDEESSIVVKELQRLVGTFGDETILACTHTGEKLNRGRDTKNRWEFLMNFTLEIHTKQEE